MIIFTSLNRIPRSQSDCGFNLTTPLRLVFQAPPGEKQESVQALLDPELALALAVALQEKAIKILASPPPETSRN